MSIEWTTVQPLKVIFYKEQLIIKEDYIALSENPV